MNFSRFKTSKAFDVLARATLVGITGCGGTSTPPLVPPPAASIGLPTPTAAAAVNTYSGAQSPGVWTLTLDNTKETYSYQAVTYPSQPNGPITGSLQSSNGFLVLSSGGYALEVKGRAAILRPGDPTNPIVFGVPQSACYPITGRLRFQYMGMWAGTDTSAIGTSGPVLGYGSIVSSTDTAGQTWQLQDMQGYPVLGPTSFSGTCTLNAGAAAISIPSQSLLYNFWAPDSNFLEIPPAATQSSLSIGPSGFLAADQSDPTASTPAGSSVAGVAEPAAPLSTTDVASKKYLGFSYQAATGGANFPGSSAVTSPISFGQVESTGTAMTGGIFPNDDVTQTPNSDISIDLGSQSSTFNGLYSAVKITVLDPFQNCANYTGSGNTATSSTNAQGYFTCTFPAIAVAGNPEGQYALFITSYNWATRLGGAPLQIYLFQQ